MDAAIRLHNLTKKYEKFTLDHVTMEIPRGSIVGLVGENGAGKTTMIKCILQLISRDEGEIYLEGEPLHKLPADWKKDVGVILPEMNFAAELTAGQMGKIMAAVQPGWQESVFRGYLDRFGLDSGKKIKDYSKGMKMKLNLTLALSHGAKLLILDEPTSGLDPVMRDDFLDILLEFVQNENHTVLISSHIISDLERAADYILFLHEGRLRLYEEKDALLETYGVVRCSEEDFRKIPQELVQGVRRHQFGCEALVKDRERIRREFPTLVADRTDVEEIILFLGKGEKA